MIRFLKYKMADFLVDKDVFSLQGCSIINIEKFLTCMMIIKMASCKLLPLERCSWTYIVQWINNFIQPPLISLRSPESSIEIIRAKSISKICRSSLLSIIATKTIDNWLIDWYILCLNWKNCKNEYKLNDQIYKLWSKLMIA